MKFSPMRRAQLVAPFGVGAMFTAPDGTSMVTAGLDGWFDTSNPDLDQDEYRVSEWRLEHSLQVAELRLPPDYRRPRRGSSEHPNLGLEVPSLLFPLWHFCSSCRALTPRQPHHAKRVRCARCEVESQAGRKKHYAPFLAQVPFVALCKNGHLQDFPWSEWVHRSVAPNCGGQLRLRATGGATLASQSVECSCGVPPRSLAGITGAFGTGPDADTNLSSQLASGDDRYVCRGNRPWVDDRVGQGCGLPLRGSLRASTSTYFGHIASAIYLPGGELGLPDGLVEVLGKSPLKHQIDTLIQLGAATVDNVLKGDTQGRLDGFDRETVERALEHLTGAVSGAKSEGSTPEHDAEQLRRPEFEVLRRAITSDDLVVRTQNVEVFSDNLRRFFRRINLVEQLRETRVMFGFSRIEPDAKRPVTELKAQLWNEEPPFGQSWLPAYVVRGEGIFLELDEDAVAAWETRPEVRKRLSLLATHPDRGRIRPDMEDESLLPRFVLLHTLAHLLINQLVFECGYSSASLRERIFCGGAPDPMAGILIYTAAGDSEGTMGGLVRMGHPGRLEPTLVAALDRAHWCSSDPVCMELGAKGQGPRSLNLAACHSCGLLPETSCEVFNVALDRGAVAGTHDDPDLGFFSDLER